MTSKMTLVIKFLAPALFFLAQPVLAASFTQDAELDLFCLKQAYPQIIAVEKDAAGIWLRLANGGKIAYERYGATPADGGQSVDVRTSMAVPYPLEPSRPLAESSPGRQRSYEMLAAFYGAGPGEVKSGLTEHRFLGKGIRLAAPAAEAFARAIPRLERLAAERGDLRRLLKPEGGYYWRNIAGESRLSPHSYGVALDLGADVAPYWRWSRKMPHPMQQTYSPEIVAIMESEGFIWGGKWHEYDLMHFEYRPELICKARQAAK